MPLDAQTAMLRAAGPVLQPEEGAFLGELVAYVERRFEAARRSAAEAVESRHAPRSDGRPEEAVHAFLRECWSVLDGLGREVSVCMRPLFPDCGLRPPEETNSQCTFYTVRRDLGADPVAAEHPVTELLWERTRGSSSQAYERLSFLYNLSLFVPINLPEGRLPGWEDLPQHVRGRVRFQPVQSISVREGTEEILEWLETMGEELATEMARVYGERAEG